MLVKKIRRSRMPSILAPTGMALAMLLGAATPGSASASVGPMHAPCGFFGANLENRVEIDAPLNDFVNQRTGSSTTCGVAGVLQPTDDARYFCFTMGTDGFTWTYLQNQRNSVRGWVRDDLLDVNTDGVTQGSIIPCGF